ncbi:MAG: isoamylase early set domain-containing protein [Caldilineaceae bacterium]|nr:isoamylase early set domain-containing protein [Caldilineaceae bacterium]
MIKKELVKSSGKVKLTFVLPADSARPQVAVVGDFNGWDPNANPLRKRNNGTMTALVTVEPGQSLQFRYCTPDGEWFNDEAADAYAVGDHGAENCVVVV